MAKRYIQYQSLNDELDGFSLDKAIERLLEIKAEMQAKNIDTSKTDIDLDRVVEPYSNGYEHFEINLRYFIDE